MMQRIKILDKYFVPYLLQEEIQQGIVEMGERMNEELKGRNPLFVGVLKGSFMFMSDLMRQIHIDNDMAFIRCRSYSGMSSTGTVEISELYESVEGRTVVIVEDMVDTGKTMVALVEKLSEMHPKEIRIATLLFKPDALRVNIHLDYVVKSIPNDFVVGYGLDYNQKGRNYKDIYVVEK